MTHRTTIEVRFAELDPYNHVNHAVYLTYFEVARTEALAEVGLALNKLASDGYQFVVTEIAVRYRRAAAAGDTLTVHTEVSHIGRAHSVWLQRIERPSTGVGSEPELVASAELKVGLTDRSGRPTRPPAGMFDSLAVLGGPGDG